MTEKQDKKFVPYEHDHPLKKMKLFFVIVNDGQADSVIARLHELGCACSVVTNAQGTAKQESYELLGFGNPKKQMIIALINEQSIDEIIGYLESRFHVSNAAKGVAFSLKISSIIGVSIYKFLTDTRENKEIKKHGKTK
ncbi:MAG: hypothetical protein WC366_00415 [Bacilli bacterium]|jgi:nitrogen regulatory protein PII